MAKDREKLEHGEKGSPMFMPFSPIPQPEGDRGRQTTCLTRPYLRRQPPKRGGGSISTSTPYSRRSVPLTLAPLVEDDSSCVQMPSLSVYNDASDNNTKGAVPTPTVDNELENLPSPVLSVPKFTFDNVGGDKLDKDPEQLSKDKIITDFILEKETPTLDSEKTTDSSISNAECNASSSFANSTVPFEFKKPASSPPGSRKRLPVATVTQLHKDSLREDVPCYCHCQVLSKEADLSDISIISAPSDNLHHSACADSSLVSTSQGDSGYQTFNSTGLSVTSDSQDFSTTSSTGKDNAPLLPKLNIPLPPLPVPCREVKKLSIEEMLQKHSPSYKTFGDFMIGRKIGVDGVDIVSELYNKGASTCLRVILRYLEVKDLKCVCSVSPTWKRVCLDDTLSRQRLKEHKAKENENSLFLGKENLLKLKQRASTATPSAPPSIRKPALSLISSLQNKSKIPTSGMAPVSPTKLLPRSDQYIQMASKLKNEESLGKCPRCLYPAKVDKVQERGCCTKKENCGFDFCIKCQMAFHGARPCSRAEGSGRSKVGSVGTKRSKKNLRRL